LKKWTKRVSFKEIADIVLSLISKLGLVEQPEPFQFRDLILKPEWAITFKNQTPPVEDLCFWGFLPLWNAKKSV
jgi:hypothetical protein